jgi:hypothetical protein
MAMDKMRAEWMSHHGSALVKTYGISMAAAASMAGFAPMCSDARLLPVQRSS